MKVSLRQLDKVVSQIKRDCLYADNNYDDVHIVLTFNDGDPANGEIVSHLVLEAEASSQSKERNNYLTSKIKCELFEVHEKFEPIVTIEVSKKLTKS